MSSEGLNSFTSTVLSHLYTSQNATGHIALSGISLYILLGVINVGLRGRSYDELSQFLGEKFEELYETNTWKNSHIAEKWIYLRNMAEELSFENSRLFCSCDLNHHYEQISFSIFSLEIKKEDFSDPFLAAHKINHWLIKDTYGSIKNVFHPSMLGKNKLIFYDTVFFCAGWRVNFNVSHTKKETFYDDHGRKFQVSMMNQESYNRLYDSKDQNYRILFKSSAKQHLYSAIVLPKEGHSLKDVLKTIKLDQIHTHFETAPMKFVKLKLPKFKLYRKNDYVKTLKEFGIKDIFDRTRADFGKMTNQSVYIGSLMQVVNVDVNEFGINVAPINELIVESSPLKLKEFYVTKPFLFLIFKFPAKPVLFSAIITNPTAV